MNAEGWGIAISLGLLTVVLTVLAGRGFLRFFSTRRHSQLGWGVGLAFGAAATAIELAAYVGAVSALMLQAYVFFSAAIVGTLSLGSVRAFRRPIYRNLYAGYVISVSAVVGVFCFLTPVVPSSMVQDGVISGNPPPLLLILSSLITGPATVVLLGFAVVSLRRAFHWKGLLMIAGASVLAAGGVFYIASFPVALYYAEFIGIVLLFVGLTDFSRWLNLAQAPAAASTERVA